MLQHFLPSERKYPPPGNAEQDAEADASAAPARILIVEDEFIVAMELESTLLDEGFVVVGLANSAEQAVRHAATLQPDLIVMDIRLIGERDGVDAAAEIWTTMQIRSIFATAHSDARTRVRAERANPLGWLTKPYDRHALIEAVQSALRQLRS